MYTIYKIISKKHVSTVNQLLQQSQLTLVFEVRVEQSKHCNCLTHTCCFKTNISLTHMHFF